MRRPWGTQPTNYLIVARIREKSLITKNASLCYSSTLKAFLRIYLLWRNGARGNVFFQLIPLHFYFSCDVTCYFMWLYICIHKCKNNCKYKQYKYSYKYVRAYAGKQTYVCLFPLCVCTTTIAKSSQSRSVLQSIIFCQHQLIYRAYF